MRLYAVIRYQATHRGALTTSIPGGNVVWGRAIGARPRGRNYRWGTGEQGGNGHGRTVETTGPLTLYRVAKECPPSTDELRSPEEAKRKQPVTLSDEDRASWDALSLWDTEEGARRIGRKYPKAGELIVRFDIPEGSGLRCVPHGPPGHVDLRGDKAELLRYLASDFLAEV